MTVYKLKGFNRSGGEQEYTALVEAMLPYDARRNLLHWIETNPELIVALRADDMNPDNWHVETYLDDVRFTKEPRDQ